MDLISKKDLLVQTGISYGQLYRWKREGLLPEEWFIKQSSFTGQETFFPKEQILSRVKAILELKDTHSLEELSQILKPDAETRVELKELAEIADIDNAFLALLERTFGDAGASIGETAIAFALFSIGKECGIQDDKQQELLRATLPVAKGRPMNDTQCTVFFLTDGSPHACLSTGPAQPAFDICLETLASVSIGETMNELRVKLQTVKNGNKTEE